MADGVEFDLHDISAAANEIVAELGIPTADAVKKLGLDLWSDVTELAPVHTGRYRAAWNLNENTPDEGVPPPHDGDIEHGTELPPPPAPGLNLGKYPVLYLSNALPYAVPIEEGHSTKKAPDGVLKVALAGRGLL